MVQYAILITLLRLNRSITRTPISFTFALFDRPSVTACGSGYSPPGTWVGYIDVDTICAVQLRK